MILIKQILVTISILGYSAMIYEQTSDKKYIRILMALPPLIVLPVVWFL